MCLIIFAYRQHPDYRLILVANRDEFYERPTRPATFWHSAPDMLAGKDLQAGGTWMGITRNGRFVALTNYRDPKGPLDTESLFLTLADRTVADDNELPDTGVGRERERVLAPMFITSEIYGTRSSTILLWKNTQEIRFEERTFDPKNPGRIVGTVSERFCVKTEQ